MYSCFYSIFINLKRAPNNVFYLFLNGQFRTLMLKLAGLLNAISNDRMQDNTGGFNLLLV